MIRVAIGYVAAMVFCAVLILANPYDFLGNDAREARLKNAPDARPLTEAVAPEAVPAQGSVAAILAEVTAGTTGESEDIAARAKAVEGDEALQKMAAAVVDAFTGVTPAAEDTLEGLVVQALADGQTDDAIDRIVNEAVAQGKVEAPAMLRTTEGKVDTAVLLASVLAQAQGDEIGQGDVSEPTVTITGGTLSMQAATEDVLYVVQAGDSLGSLALRFYGDAGLYTAIYKANRQVMDTPESLAYGMKLLIPARSGL